MTFTAMTGQRPVIFYSNGYEHWLWDDLRYPPREVQGFYKKNELEVMIRRREDDRPPRTWGSANERRGKEPDPNSPFAKLAALKAQLEANAKERH